MKKSKTKQAAWRYSFAIALIIIGIILGNLNIQKEFLGFSGVGIWLIYVGFVMLAVTTLQLLSNKKRIIDERMNLIALKTARIVFLLLIISAFTIMVWDGIKTIQMPYSLFMSYFICGLVFAYFVIYKILERYY